MNNLAVLYHAQGDLSRARDLYERALRIGESKLGAGHTDVAVWCSNLAGVLRAQGDLTAARSLYERSLEIGEANLGADHPSLAIWRSNLAVVLRQMGELETAVELYQRVLLSDELVYGPRHLEVATDLNNLASVLEDLAGWTTRGRYTSEPSASTTSYRSTPSKWCLSAILRRYLSDWAWGKGARAVSACCANSTGSARRGSSRHSCKRQ